MLENAITNIVEAEKSVEDNVKASIIEAKNIIANANGKANDILGKSEKIGRSEYKEYMNKANYAAERESESVLLDCEEQGIKAVQKALKNESEAISYVIEELLKKNG